MYEGSYKGSDYTTEQSELVVELDIALIQYKWRLKKYIITKDVNNFDMITYHMLRSFQGNKFHCFLRIGSQP